MHSAIYDLITLSDNKLYSVQKLEWWLLKYVNESHNSDVSEELYSCCFADVPCEHVLKSLEPKFSNLYCRVKKLVLLHKFEDYATSELLSYYSIKSNSLAVKNWVKKNNTIASETLVSFFVDYLNYDKDKTKVLHLKLFQSDYPDFEIYADRKDFLNTIAFIELYNQLQLN